MNATHEIQAEPCTSCGHRHATATLAYICVGCPCPLTPGMIADGFAAADAQRQAIDPNGAPEWLAALCKPDARPEAMRSPFPFDEHGVSFAVATDGHILIAIRGAFDMRPAPEFAAEVASIFSLPGAGRGPETTVPFQRFLGWAKRGIPEPHTGPCPECNDTKRVKCDECRGKGWVECTCDCGDIHHAECDECDGTRIVACECLPPKLVILGTCAERLVNRALFGPFMEHLAPAAEVHVSALQDSTTPVFFWTDQWRVIVMPMRPPRPGEPPHGEAEPL